jgi:hypothetical protein
MFDWSQFVSTNDKVLFVASDAGGAAILAAMAKQISTKSTVLASGPGTGIFIKQGFEPLTKIGSLSNFDLIITGSSAESNLELEAIKKAKKANIKSISFLDNWSNYDIRFKRGLDFFLPDEIWVGDESAFSMAKEMFPKTRVRLVENPLWIMSKEEVVKLKGALVTPSKTSQNQFVILFLMEPLSVSEQEKIFRKSGLKIGHFDVFFNFCQKLELVLLDNYKDLFCVLDVNLRPHPSQYLESFDLESLNHRFSFNIKLSKDSLPEDLAGSHLVVGGNSSALAIAHEVGMTTFSHLPFGMTRHLPFEFAPDLSSENLQKTLRTNLA